MKKFLAILLGSLFLTGSALAYTVRPGDYPLKLWGKNWRAELAKYGISDPRKLPVGLVVNEDNEDFLGTTPTPTSSANRMYVEAPDWQLFNGAATGDTTLTLDDLEDIYGAEINMDFLGNKGYGRINPDGVSESITFTGITTNSDGTKTLTGVRTILSRYPYTETSGLTRSHSIGSLFRLSNTAGFYNDLTNKYNNESIEGLWTFNDLAPRVTTTLTQLSTQTSSLASIQYVNSVATSGAPNAGLAVKGLVEMAATSSFSATGTTGAYLVHDASQSVTTSAGAADAGKYIRLNATGTLHSSFGGTTSSLATLNATSTVVQNPASATTSPGYNSIPLSRSASSTISETWIATSSVNGNFLRSTSTGAYWDSFNVTSTVSSTKQLEVVHQNLTGKTLMVVITFHLTAVSEVIVRTGPTSTPANVAGQVFTNTGGSVEADIPIIFFVPPLYYYAAYETGAGGTITRFWVEWQMW